MNGAPPPASEGAIAILVRRALRLEYATIGWMAIEAAVAITAGVFAGSVALVGFGLDSVIEAFAASVVIWQLRGGGEERERTALRLIAITFFLLATYIVAVAIRDLASGSRAAESPAGIAVTAAALVVMPGLGFAKRRTGRAMASEALVAEAAESLFCASLAAITLLGLALNTAFGLWWADPVAGLVISAFAVREGSEAWRGEERES